LGERFLLCRFSLQVLNGTIHAMPPLCALFKPLSETGKMCNGPGPTNRCGVSLNPASQRGKNSSDQSRPTGEGRARRVGRPACGVL
jgi:hypothetical protein